jgi:hypothetical protein
MSTTTGKAPHFSHVNFISLSCLVLSKIWKIPDTLVIPDGERKVAAPLLSVGPVFSHELWFFHA